MVLQALAGLRACLAGAQGVWLPPGGSEDPEHGGAQAPGPHPWALGMFRPSPAPRRPVLLLLLLRTLALGPSLRRGIPNQGNPEPETVTAKARGVDSKWFITVWT